MAPGSSPSYPACTARLESGCLVIIALHARFAPNIKHMCCHSGEAAERDRDSPAGDKPPSPPLLVCAALILLNSTGTLLDRGSPSLNFSSMSPLPLPNGLAAPSRRACAVLPLIASIFGHSLPLRPVSKSAPCLPRPSLLVPLSRLGVPPPPIWRTVGLAAVPQSQCLPSPSLRCLRRQTWLRRR